jgi:hypothetical protein
MHDATVKLLLGDVEVEVLEEALDLYLRARPAAADRRFDYRYRVAHGILGTLSQQGHIEAALAPGDDEVPGRDARSASARVED